MSLKRRNMMKPRTGEAERQMEARIKVIGERDRAKRGAKSDLVVRHDPSIIRRSS